MIFSKREYHRREKGGERAGSEGATTEERRGFSGNLSDTMGLVTLRKRREGGVYRCSAVRREIGEMNSF